eukprot:g3077.t1
MIRTSLRAIFCDASGRPLEEAKLNEILHDVEEGTVERIDIDKFRSLLKKRSVQLNDRESAELFKLIDENGDGSISVGELHNAVVHDFKTNYYTGEKRSKAEVMGINDDIEIEAQSVVKTDGNVDMFVNIKSAEADANNTLLLQHASGMSIEMVKHLFLDLDEDHSGNISKSELHLLGPMLGVHWTDEEIDDIVAAADTNNDGVIDFDEFYKWTLKNIKLDEKAVMKKRDHVIELNKYNDLDPKLIRLLDETCLHVMQEAPERPGETELDQFGHGRFLKEHLTACYLQAKIWGASQDFCNACLFHAIYEPGFQFRVIELSTARPFLRYILGEHTEWLLYNFIGASRSIFNPDGMYHAPRDPGTWRQMDFATGEAQVMPAEKRRDLVRMEFSNNYDKMYIHDEMDPVKSLWLYCQHINVYDLLLDGQKEVVGRYGARGKEATCEQVADWHEHRFKRNKITDTWTKHIAMFREGGQYYEREKNNTLFI